MAVRFDISMLKHITLFLLYIFLFGPKICNSEPEFKNIHIHLYENDEYDKQVHDKSDIPNNVYEWGPRKADFWRGRTGKYTNLCI